MREKTFFMALLLMLGVGVVFGTTDTIPSLPASYYGKILTENNQTLNGILVAKIDGKERGSIKVVNNLFGGPSYTDSKLIVEGSYYNDEGKEVEFYFNGIKLNSTHKIYWHSGNIVELTLLYGNVTIPNKPPVADFNYSILGDVNDGKEIQFNDLSSDDDGKITKWLWDFGDGTTSNEQNPVHIYHSSGTYNVSLTVWDDANDNNTFQKTINISNNPPKVDFTYNANYLTVDFVANASDDGIIKSYIWDFGDGTSETGKSVSHTYANEGIYNVVLTVIDNLEGKNFTKKQITVVKPVDFEMNDIIIPSSIYSSNEYTIYGKIYSNDAEVVEIGFYENGSLKEIKNKSLNVGTNYVSFKWTPGGNSKYCLSIKIDPNNKINETNENNNELTKSVSVQSVDYGIYSIYAPYKTTIDKNTEITVVLSSNKYDKNVSLCVVAVNNNNNNKEIIFNGTTEVWNYKYFYTAWKPKTNGTYTITAKIDPENSINEQNENNNQYVKKIIVEKPDVSVGWMNLPYTTITNKTLTRYITLYSNTPLNTTLLIKVNETGEVLINKTIHINGYAYQYFNWTPINNRTYHIVATIDPENSIDEQNENNNQYVKKIIVEKPYFNITGKYCPTVVKEGNHFWMGIYYKTNYRTNYTLYLNYNHAIFNSTYGDTIKGNIYPTGWWGGSIWTWMRALKSTDDAECINGTLIISTENGSIIKNISCCVEVQPQGVVMKSSNLTVLTNKDNDSFNLIVYNATPIRKIKGTVDIEGGSDGAVFKGLYFLNNVPNKWGCIEQIASPTIANIFQKKYYYDMHSYSDNNILKNKTKSNVKIGIKTIINRQTSDGSWQWWGYGKSSVYFSAYSVYAMSLAYNDPDFKGISGDASNEKAVIEKGVKWLINNQSSDGAWRPIPGSHEYIRETIPLTAWTIMSLAEARDATDNNTLKEEINNSIEKGVNFLLNQNLTKTEEISMSIIAFNKSGLDWTNVSGNISTLANRLLNKQEADGHWNPDLWTGWAYWEPETTGYALMALHYSGYPNDNSNVSKGIYYLLTNFKPGWGWGSTKQTATAVQSIITLDPTATLNSNVKIYLDGKYVDEVNITNKNPHYVITLPKSDLKIGNHKITAVSNGTGRIVVSGLIKQWVMYGDVPNNLKKYIDPIAKNYTLKVKSSKSKAYVNEPITIYATINNSKNTQDLQYMFFEIKLPSNTTFTNATDENGEKLVFIKNETTGNYYVAIGDVINKSIYSFHFNATVHKPSVVNFSAKVYPMYKPDEIAISNITNLEVVPEDISVNASIPSKTYSNNTVEIPVNITYNGIGTKNTTVSVKIDNSTVKEENKTLSSGNNLINITLENISIGNHSIAVYAENLPDEINTANNMVLGTLAVESPKNKFMDVAVESIGLNDSNIVVGQNYTVSVAIRNLGNIDASNVVISLYANDTEIGKQTINIGSNNTTNVTFTWTPISSGTYTLKSETILANDSNISNNNKNISVNVKPQTVSQPDLIVESISTPSEITVNKSTIVTVTIKNIGKTNANGFSLKLSDSNNNTIGLETNITLNMNDSKTLSFNWTPSSEGAITLTAIVDCDNILIESNESNNIKNVTITASSEVMTYTLHLVKGWNMISIPVNVKNWSREAVLKSIEGKYDGIYHWNGTCYVASTPHPITHEWKPFELEPGKGYWIHVNATEEVMLKVE